MPCDAVAMQTIRIELSLEIVAESKENSEVFAQLLGSIIGAEVEVVTWNANRVYFRIDDYRGMVISGGTIRADSGRDISEAIENVAGQMWQYRIMDLIQQQTQVRSSRNLAGGYVELEVEIR